MDRHPSAHSLFLVALPYALLLLGMLLATAVLDLLPRPLAGDAWWSVRWLLRIGFVVGTWVGWRMGRPAWFYTWLGFATYEAVATLLAGVIWWTEQAWTAPAFWLLGPFLLITFSPYFATAIWVAQRDTQLAVFTVFPHAALLVPLFLLVSTTLLGSDWSLVGASVLPVILAGTTAVFYRWLVPDVPESQDQRNQGWALLTGGMVGASLVLVIGLSLGAGAGFGALFLIFPLFLLAVVVLFAPVLFWPIARAGDRLLRQIGAGPLLDSLSALFHDLVKDASARLSTFSGGKPMADASPETNAEPLTPQPVIDGSRVGPGLERLYKLSVIVLTAFVVLVVVVLVGRATVYKIHEYERGLHLRGGRFIGSQDPGWHFQIPLVDTVIIVKVNERLGYVERIPAMTSDNVFMDVSLQYTYRVTDPQRFALQVDDPERIVFEFVQGKLRDVVNTKAMTEVMNQRALMNQEVMDALKEKETQYGVQFVTVQMQSASPPEEVLTAIKDRMVAVQRQEQAQAEAAQQKTLADAQFYTAQKEADADAYQISTTAQAEAESIRLTTEARQLSLRAMLAELADKGAIGEKYIDYLIAQELKENSKWILGGESTPIVDLRASGQ